MLICGSEAEESHTLEQSARRRNFAYANRLDECDLDPGIARGLDGDGKVRKKAPCLETIKARGELSPRCGSGRISTRSETAIIGFEIPHVNGES